VRALARVCTACGAAAESEQAFCDECGAPLAADPQPAAPPPAVREAPAAERRLVSVLIADLVGFTTLSVASRM
jgi:adenylate cyclase